MRIGIFGVVVIALSIIMFQRREWLLLSAIFFSPFYECGVAIVGSLTIQPGHYFLLLYTIALMFSGRLLLNKPDLLLTGFVFISFVSIIKSLMIKNNDMVYGVGNGMRLKHATITGQNFTQYLYLIAAFLMYVLVVSYICADQENLKKVFKTFMYSGIAILLIGFYQQIANFAHLPFEQIFRFSTHEMWQDLGRTQSVFGEASFFAQYCVCLLPFILNTANKVLRNGSLVLMVVLGILARSTTFLIGFSVVYILYLISSKKKTKEIVLTLFILLSFIVVLPQSEIYNRLNSLIAISIDKFSQQAESGRVRFSALSHMLGVFTRHPILGVGYGSGLSQDVYSTILATTGLCGFILIITYLCRLVLGLLRVHWIDEAKVAILSLIGFMVTALAVPNIGYLNYWVIFAICKGVIFTETQTVEMKFTKLGNYDEMMLLRGDR